MSAGILKKLFGNSQQSGPSPDTPIGEIEFVVFDTELTGLDRCKDSIVSVGALTMTGTRIDVGKPFYRIVDPRTELTGKSIVIHGITPSETVGAPDIETLLPEFLEFCKDRVMVGHFVAMDIGFVNNDMKRVMGKTLDNPAVDTINLYRHIRQNDGERCAFYDEQHEDANLFTLAGQYDITVTGAHNALGDAYITAQLFQRFLSILQGRGAKTLKDLLKAGKS